MSLLKGLQNDDILSKQDETYTSAFLGADLELDGSTRRRQINLYRNDEVILAVEPGVTLGLLKLIYSSDSKNQGILQGVRSRATTEPPAVSSVILSDDRVLDKDEYDLVIQEPSSSNESNFLQLRNSTQAIPLASPSSNAIFITNANNSDKKKGQFVCEFCHLPFVSKAKFQRHRRIHTEEKPYMCVYCNETFPHHLDLRKHREEQHMLNKPFKCNCCPKTFATRAELRGHLWRHTGEKNHECRLCRKTFATKGNLKLHFDKHIGVHKHKCPFCPQRFTSHSSLEAHMAKHTGLKAYKCRYCTKSYAQAGQLTAHERLHTGEKPFVCVECGKGFRLNSTRLAHEKRHSGARPHLCETCGRSFAMLDHLRRHKKTHENKLDRIVTCPFCKKKIFQGRNMRKHLSRHRELNLTELQAKTISASLKPDRQENERNEMEEEQKGSSYSANNKKPLNCQRCNTEVKSIRKLFEHLSEVHYQRPLTPAERKEIRLIYGVQKLHHCQLCFQYFVDYRLLRSHMLSEHPEQAEDVGFTAKGSTGRGSTSAHKCPNCSMYFDLRSTLDEHIIKDHLTTIVRCESQTSEAMLQFRCWYCPESFHTPEEVVSHMTTQHESLDVLSKRVEMTESVGENDVSSTGLWACPHCPVNVKSEQEYNDHVALHTQSNESPSKGHEGSCTISSSVNSAPEDVNSYLNSIDGNEPESWNECVVKKYLKTDDTQQTKDSVSNTSCNDKTKTGSEAENVLPVLHDVSVQTSEQIETNVSEAFSPSCLQDESEGTIDSTVDISSTTIEVQSSGDVSLNNNDTELSRSSQTNVLSPAKVSLNITSQNSLLNTHAEKIVDTGGFCTSPSLELTNPNLTVQSSASLSMPSIEMTYTASVMSGDDFTRNSTSSSVIENDCLVIKNNHDYVADSNKSTSKISLNSTLSNSISTNNEDDFTDRRHKMKKKKEKKKLKGKKKLESSKRKLDHSTSSGSCSLMESCRFCSDVFKNKTELNNHVKIAHRNEDGGAVPFRCWFCTTTFTTPEEVVAHMTNAHDNLDNLSRRVEMTELKNQMAAEKENCRLKLLKLDDASLSPMDSLKCPKCPKKLESKEAYELHMIVHEASHNTDLLRTGTDLFNRHRLDRNSVNPTAMDEVTLPGDQISMDEHTSSNYGSENFDLAKQSVLTSCVNTNSFTKLNDQSSVMGSLPSLMTTDKVPSKDMLLTMKEMISSNEQQRTDFSIQKQDKVGCNEVGKVAHQPPSKKSKTENEKSSNSKDDNTFIVDANININMCSHCSRVFCTKRALDVHTFKMHGKEYMQKSQTRATTPFNCWFCSANFPSPEQVVEHMTNAHENLDSLSKRITEQEIPTSNLTSVQPKFSVSTPKPPANILNNDKNLPVPVVQQKQVIPIAQLNSGTVNTGTAQVPVADTSSNPPRGFKVSYALAYVPIYIPERNEKGGTNEEKKD